jgi:hypothetical protein
MWLAKSVIPECNIDSCLFNVLLQFGKDGVNHTKGNTTVVKKVIEKFDDLFCVAIIDKDRRDIDFIVKECEKIELKNTDDYFLFFKRNGKNHYFIQIVPVVEKWILKVADELGIKLSDFDINALTLRELNYITKTTDSKNDERFKKLFREFVRKSEEINFEPVLKLRNIVRYILEKQFNADINELKNV